MAILFVARLGRQSKFQLTVLTCSLSNHVPSYMTTRRGMKDKKQQQEQFTCITIYIHVDGVAYKGSDSKKKKNKGNNIIMVTKKQNKTKRGNLEGHPKL